MKLFGLLISIIVFLTIDSHDGRESRISFISVDGAQDRDFPDIRKRRDSANEAQQHREITESRNSTDKDKDPDSAVVDQQQLPKEEEKGQIESKLRQSSCIGRPKIQCSILGGSCVEWGARCYGRRVPSGCTRQCDCCIPGCPEDQEFFSPPGSKQCFKLFKDKTRDWPTANAKCKEEGLVLPHPYDPVTLRAYIVTRFGYSDVGRALVVWLDGRGNNQYVMWLDTNTPIKAANPYWWSTKSYDPSSTRCLQLRAYADNWKESPGQPYHTQPCDWGDFYYTLCEWKYGRVDM